MMNTSSVRSVFSTVTLMLLFAITASAHHSFAGQFDPNKSMEIEGELIEIRWANPHAHLKVRTVDNGKVVVWTLETAGASQMVRSGVLPEYLKVGDKVRVAGWPPVTAAREMHATNLLTPDGKELLLFRGATAKFTGRGTGSYDYARKREGDRSRPDLGLFRVWSFTAVGPFLLPEDINASFNLNTYPMTDAARRSVANFNRAKDNPTLNCKPKGMPMIMENPYPIAIAKKGNDIVIQIEEYDLLRTVHMNQAAAPRGTRPSLLGYSVGKWEGSTLVVTTTHVNFPWFDQAGIPQSEQSILVERFTPTTDGSRLDYTVTVTDPINFTKPVTLNRYWLDLGETLVRYNCQERK
ncbi:MAG TPA: DUF6152 family protein [Terriglobia bacterium]|nr:DUF6152 family protein [Terriglobia bacterium]